MRKSLLHVLVLTCLFFQLSFANSTSVNPEFLTLDACLADELCEDLFTSTFATYQLLSNPSIGSVQFNDNGTFCYQAAETGVDEFTVESCFTSNGTDQETCEGKIWVMTVQYVGQANNASIYVKGKKNNSPVFVTFDGVNSGDILELDATGLLTGASSTEWHFYLNGNLDAKIHTSCSVFILDQTFGGFHVLAYTDGQGNDNSVATADECVITTVTINVDSCDDAPPAFLGRRI